MTFDVDITEDDYINFNIFTTFNSEQGKKMILMGRMLGICISLLVMLVLVIAGASTYLIICEAVFLTIFSIVIFFRYPGMVKKRIRKGIIKMKDEGKLPYVEKATLEFREDELFENRMDGTKLMPYTDFIDACVTDDCIYLRQGAQMAVLLPKRCLGDREGELLEFLATKMKITREYNK